MRMQEFFETLKSYEFENAIKLAQAKNIVGGWEHWFQVELAMHLCGELASPTNIIREKTYPDQAARCDFYVEYGGGRGSTYIELKCQIPQRSDPIHDALLRFESDIIKQKAYTLVAGFCLLASCGQWTDDHIRHLLNILNVYQPASSAILVINEYEAVYYDNIQEALEMLYAGCFSLIGISP